MGVLQQEPEEIPAAPPFAKGVVKRAVSIAFAILWLLRL